METQMPSTVASMGSWSSTPLLQTTVPGNDIFLGRQDRELKDFEVILGMVAPLWSTPALPSLPTSARMLIAPVAID